MPLVHASGDEQVTTRRRRAARKIKPEYARAYFNRGVAFNAQNKTENAIADYRKAIECEHLYAEAYLNLAFDLEYAEGAFAEAD